MKLFHVVSTAVLGTAMVIGVGLALNKTQVQQAKATSDTVTWNATAANNLGSAISAVNGTATGTIKTGSYSWNYTRTLKELASGKSDNISFQGGTWIQLGSNNARESLEFTTSNIPGTIESVSVQAATAGNHAVTIQVGSTKYVNAQALETYSGTAGAANPTPGDSNIVTGTGSSSGVISISFEGSSRKAMLIKSISVTYNEGGIDPGTYTVTYNSNGGTGTMTDPNSPYDSGDTVTVLANSFTKSGYLFTNWNTASDGTGTSYNPGATFSINKNTTLYAQWEVDPASTYTDDTTEQTITWDLSKETYVSASATQVKWNSNRFSVVADKAGAGTDTNNYLPPSNTSSRFYTNSRLTFTPLGDDDIIKIEATATTDGYTTALTNSDWTNAVADYSGHVVTITPEDGTQAVSGIISATTGLTKIVIYYGTAVPLTKYSVIDHIDNGSLNKDEAVEGSTLNVTIIPDAGYDIPPALTAVTMAGNPVAYTYNAGVVTVVNVQGDITIEGECVRSNPIKALYSKSSGAAVDVYGYYVGFLDGTGPVIMDGEYGIVIYNKEADVSSYVEKTTILHVTGSISIYKELYEIGSASITKVDSYAGELDAPVVYSTQGGETADCASRLTTLSGKLTAVTTGSLDAEPAASDIKMTFLVNSHNITVFYKKAAQKAEDMAALKAVLSTENEITVKGFTSWYSGFQIQMSGVVGEDPSYTAAIFAQDLLDQTDVVCAEYNPSTNPNVDRDALVAIWSDLASADKYPSLPAAQKTILAEAEGDKTSADVVEQAMARYDLLTAKYNLNNFINGRNPSSGARGISLFGNTNTSIVVISCIVAASVSALAAGLILTIKKKKHY